MIDASVAVKWHLRDEDHVDRADRVLQRFANGQLELVAPNYIRYEFASAVAMATVGRAPRLTYRQGRQAIEQFLALAIPTRDSPELIADAYELVHQYVCALYDALYLALARRFRLTLITADREFHQRVRSLRTVVWIGNYR